MNVRTDDGDQAMTSEQQGGAGGAERRDVAAAPPLEVIARPRRIRLLVIPVAIAFLALFSVVGVLLKHGSTGVHFETSDQVSMIAIGVALAAGVSLFLRPRVRANSAGVEIRNVFFTKNFAWSDTDGVSFPDGARWAHLELPDDEYEPIMAIQSLDGARAVTAMRALRRHHRASGARS